MLQKLEDRIVQLLDELDNQQKRIEELENTNQSLTQTNEALKQQTAEYQHKIESMLKLIDGVTESESSQQQTSDIAEHSSD